MLLRELEALGERLGAADVRVVGALRPGMVASAIRVAFDPWSRPGLARLAAADRERDGIDEARPGRSATEASWVDVPDGRRRSRHLLDRELAAHGGRRGLPLPAPPPRADGSRDRRHDRADLAAAGDPRGRGARTSDLADRSFAAAWASWRRRARRDGRGDSRREEELADGHAAVRFAGYVTVSARSDEELERHCSEVEHAAQMARLEPLRLYGQQEEAFTYTLPLCRGLR